MKTARLLLPLLALLLATDAVAITRGKACRLACGWLVDQCVAEGGRRFRCRRRTVRDCKRFGLEFCTPPPTTTTTLPPIITPTTSTTIRVVPTTSTTTSTVPVPTTTTSSTVVTVTTSTVTTSTLSTTTTTIRTAVLLGGWAFTYTITTSTFTDYYRLTSMTVTASGAPLAVGTNLTTGDPVGAVRVLDLDPNSALEYEFILLDPTLEVGLCASFAFDLVGDDGAAGVVAFFHADCATLFTPIPHTFTGVRTP